MRRQHGIIHLYRRALKAERQLNRLEKQVVFSRVEKSNGGDGTKSKVSHEEVKDFSRIIAANMLADVNLKRTREDNAVRMIIFFIGMLATYQYLKSKEEDLQKQSKNSQNRFAQKK